MNQIIQTHQNQQPFIPAWVVVVQSICFAILYAVWMLPKTIFLRNTCLGIGAALSLFVVFRYRKAFLSKFALPAYLLIALFAWLVFHLLFLSNDYPAQYRELTSAWKNCAIAMIFGLGFGISLSTMAQNCGAEKGSIKKINKANWLLLWLGLSLPELIYIVKWFLTYYGFKFGIVMPDYLKLWASSAPHYISKNTYVCFCLPVLAIALGQIKLQLDKNYSYSFAKIFYIVIIFGVLFVFWGERIRNGIVYSLVCAFLLFFSILFASLRKWDYKKYTLTFCCLIAVVICLFIEIIKSPDWQSFYADAKVAIMLDQYPQWKYDGKFDYPKNNLGQEVSKSNYERISWFVYGVNLVPTHPLGYGILQSSFGHLAKIDYPDSRLHQSHSGWIDLALGIGLPGMLLILSALIMAMRNLSIFLCRPNIFLKNTLTQRSYLSACYWALLSLSLAWLTTELSQKVYIDILLFWISLACGLVINLKSHYPMVVNS